MITPIRTEKHQFDIYPKKCCKEPKGSVPNQASYPSSIVYLKLRSSGCPFHKAINFSKRTHCKTDFHQEYDGPVNHKIL